jgi:sugar phosphate isomerase/epimerase
MKISFSTLGCPAWDLETICQQGQRLGFHGVDFRGIQETMDITLMPAFGAQLAGTRTRLEDAGLQVSCVSSSIRICDSSQLEANLEEARRTIPVAMGLACQRVRVFGNGNLEGHSRLELADMGRDCMEQILQLDGARQLQWTFETHDLWTSGADSALLLERIADPQFGVLWDMGHTTRVGGETPAQTYEAVSGRVMYVHVKDAIHDTGHADAMQDGWRYVPPGSGQLPLTEAIALLRGAGYDGWLMFEHEKRWHPELEPPETIFPLFVEWVRPLVA